MTIRRAEKRDTGAVANLLEQVLSLHQEGRPDIFKAGTRKYTDKELEEIFKDNEKPVFVAEIEEKVVGYAFCIITEQQGNNILADMKTLYIDDICVDKNQRRCGVGKSLYEHVIAFAKEIGCYNVTLNVWETNTSAKHFYEQMGMSVQKTVMEKII